MRLTPEQQSIIRSAAAESFGAGVSICLFGSRIDDNKKGGDIDLLIETNQSDIAKVVQQELAFVTKLKMKLGDQKIDVLVDYPARRYTPPIFSIAKQTGIRL